MSAMDRRRFLKVVGATGGGAVALAGCGTDNAEKLIPYLVPPDNQVPGLATYYASTCRECPAGCGLHVKTREGRAIKLEGNPDSPINRGRLCARGQAGLQGLYNPDRIRGPMARNASGGFDPISWDDALARVAQRIGTDGARVRFLSGAETGSFARLVDEWLAALGASARVAFEPFGYEALRFANRAVFGTDAIPRYHLADARYVLSFGTDFLETWLSPVEHAREFANGHALHDDYMGRYVHVEPRLSMTGMSADEWVAATPGTEGLLALAMAQVVLTAHGGNAPRDAGRLRGLLDGFTPASVADRVGVPAETITRLAGEFAAGPSIAVAGGMGAQHDQAHATAAAVNLLNYVAGNVGRTVTFDAVRSEVAGSGYAALTDLVQAMQDGQVGVLLVHEANPAHAAPPALGFAEAMGRVGFKVSFARFLDETAALCDVILPDHDPLEQWNDSEPRAGVRALQQPVMQPVFDTRQTADVLLSLAASTGGALAARFASTMTYRDYLQASWRTVQRSLGDRGPFETFWNASLQAGGRFAEPRARAIRLAAGVADLTFDTWAKGDGLVLIAYPSPVLHDGRGANRPWLQELPDPVSKITWSSWVEINPETADAMGIADGDFVAVANEAGTVEAPAFRYPGIAPGVVAVPIGQGHTGFGRYAEGRGANVYRLLSATPTVFGGLSHYASVSVTPTGAHERLATNVGSSRQLGRGIAQSTTYREIEEGHFHPFHVAHAAEAPEHVEEAVREWGEREKEEWKQHGSYAGEHPRWAMAIDLTRCNGCSACVTACYAENNLATVGKAGVQHGREMSWIRIERYFDGGENGEPLRVEILPMMCQQCGHAPCEPVCPVFAAYHTVDGLNGQVYNRCVGTRYCGNNCPYKVRYFNWFDHGNANDPAFSWPEPLHLLLNPDVTVRSKGVMEKCTFCVQRIRDRQHHAGAEHRPLADGEIRTACQQSCPADAIVFGDLNDPDSAVSSQWRHELGYRVLDGLNTDAGIMYLTNVRNTVEV